MPGAYDNILLTMTIELDDDIQHSLVVYENDDPSVLAYHFGEKYSLDSEEICLVEENIRENIERVIEENEMKLVN